MPNDKFVRVSDISIGADSRTGMAFHIEAESGDGFWVPYSVCRKRTVTHNKLQDSIEVTAWWCEKNEIEGEPV